MIGNIRFLTKETKMTADNLYHPLSTFHASIHASRIHLGCKVCLPSGGPIMTISSFYWGNEKTPATSYSASSMNNVDVVWFDSSNSLRSGTFAASSLLYYYTGK